MRCTNETPMIQSLTKYLFKLEFNIIIKIITSITKINHTQPNITDFGVIITWYLTYHVTLTPHKVNINFYIMILSNSASYVYITKPCPCNYQKTEIVQRAYKITWCPLVLHHQLVWHCDTIPLVMKIHFY